MNLRNFILSPNRINELNLFIFLSLGLSVIFHLIGLHRVLIFLIFNSLAILHNGFFLGRKISKDIILIFFVFIILSLIPSLYWFNLRYTLQVFLFFLTYLSLSLFTYSEIKRVIEWLTIFLMILAILAIASSIITFLFNTRQVLGTNPDGRNIYLGFLTFSNAAYKFGSHLVIRPSGIYDEPGVFSFIICLVCVFRFYLNLPLKRTILLLLLGFITLSLAHLLFTIIFVFSLFFKGTFKLNAKNVSIIVISFVGLFIFLFDSIFFVILKEFLFSRMNFNSIDEFGGNRSEPVKNALSLLNFKTFFLGVDSICVSDAIGCSSIYGNFRDNPLSPLLTRGIFASLIFYFFLIVVFFKSLLLKNNFILFGVFLLLLQRPSILLPGFDIYYALILLLCFNPKFKSRENFNHYSGL